MTTYRSVVRTTAAAFGAVFALCFAGSALFSDSTGPRRGPPGADGKPPGWFQLYGTPVAINDQPVEDWDEVNRVLRGTSYRAMDPWSQHRFDHDKLPEQLDGGTFTVTVAIPVHRAAGSVAKERVVTVRRWFAKQSLFTRAGPSRYQRFEIEVEHPLEKADHLN